MGYVLKRGSKWYAILWNRIEKKKSWFTLPATVTTRRTAMRCQAEMQDDLDRNVLLLPRKSRMTSSVTWVSIASDVLEEKASNRHWFLACNGMVKRFVKAIGKPTH